LDNSVLLNGGAAIQAEPILDRRAKGFLYVPQKRVLACSLLDVLELKGLTQNDPKAHHLGTGQARRRSKSGQVALGKSQRQRVKGASTETRTENIVDAHWRQERASSFDRGRLRNELELTKSTFEIPFEEKMQQCQ
jgi:hypothetical protein